MQLKKSKINITSPENKTSDAESMVWVDSKLNVHVEKRAQDRFPAYLQARLFYGNIIYTGIVTNLSKNGMFINTKVQFPVNSEFLVVVLLDKRPLKLPIKVRRTAKKENNDNSMMDNGIGIELLDTPQKYLDFVGCCKSSMQHSY
jgi:Tfp pilus assembly protein PilZ